MTYQYIIEHVQQHGELPSVESVVAASVMQDHPFEASDSVESIDTLAVKLRDRNLKLDLKGSIRQWATDYTAMSGQQLLANIRSKTESLFGEQSRYSRGGVNWATSGDERFREYQARKVMDYGRLLPAMFPEITAKLGGYERGDLVSVMAFTGRGKSWLGLKSALMANTDGYRVLVESAEMPKIKCEFRLDTLAAHFSNRQLWTGSLDMRVEEEYRRFTSQFTRSSGRPDFIVQDSEDWLEGLSLAQLNADIERYKPDLVVIDQFNLMRFNAHNRDAKSALSRELKQIAARKRVVILVLYQTNGDYERGRSTDAEGIRELKLPQLSDYSETIAVIQDSSIVYGFDAVTWSDESTGKRRGKAIMGVLKSRDGGAEGEQWDLEWMPDDGVIEVRKPTDAF